MVYRYESSCCRQWAQKSGPDPGDEIYLRFREDGGEWKREPYRSGTQKMIEKTAQRDWRIDLSLMPQNKATLEVWEQDAGPNSTSDEFIGRVKFNRNNFRNGQRHLKPMFGTHYIITWGDTLEPNMSGNR